MFCIKKQNSSNNDLRQTRNQRICTRPKVTLAIYKTNETVFIKQGSDNLLWQMVEDTTNLFFANEVQYRNKLTWPFKQFEVQGQLAFDTLF